MPNATPNASKRCPKCGQPLADEAMGGLCPNCLVQVTFGEDSQVEGGKPPLPDKTVVIPKAPPSTLDPEPSSSSRIRYFGDYELLEEIARGGMGVVYKARQVSLNRAVAVKMILGGQLADEEQVKRFHTEAEAAANLQHPNIVAIHEVGIHLGLHYFSMDYVEGTSLAELLETGPLPPQRAAACLKTIAEAIHYAHLRGIFHRDLKPANVLMDSRDQPRIADFGLAKMAAEGKNLTRSGAVMGTPAYMPPEQASGRLHEIGPPTDTYALGAILYHMMTGRPPFTGQTFEETLLQVLHDQPAPVSKLNPQVPPDLETICAKCLEKDPARRYASARALAEDLGRFLNHEPILARPASTGRKLWSWLLHHPWVLSGMAVAVIAALLFLTYGMWEKLRFQESSSLLQLARTMTKDLKPDSPTVKKDQAEILETLRRAAEIKPRMDILDAAVEVFTMGAEGIRLIPLGHGVVTRTNHLNGKTRSECLLAAECSLDGGSVAAQFADGALEVIDLASGSRKFKLQRKFEEAQPFALSPNGNWLAWADSTKEPGEIEIWDVRRSQLQSTLVGHHGRVTALAFLPQQGLLVSGETVPRTNGAFQIKFWNLEAAQARTTLEIPVSTNPDRLHPNVGVRRFRIARDGNFLGYDGVPSGWLYKLAELPEGEAQYSVHHLMREPLGQIGIDLGEFRRLLANLTNSWLVERCELFTVESNAVVVYSINTRDYQPKIGSGPTPSTQTGPWPARYVPGGLTSDCKYYAPPSGLDRHFWFWNMETQRPAVPGIGKVIGTLPANRVLALDGTHQHLLLYAPHDIQALIALTGLGRCLDAELIFEQHMWVGRSPGAQLTWLTSYQHEKRFTPELSRPLRFTAPALIAAIVLIGMWLKFTPYLSKGIPVPRRAVLVCALPLAGVVLLALCQLLSAIKTLAWQAHDRWWVEALSMALVTLWACGESALSTYRRQRLIKPRTPSSEGEITRGALMILIVTAWSIGLLVSFSSVEDQLLEIGAAAIASGVAYAYCTPERKPHLLRRTVKLFCGWPLGLLAVGVLTLELAKGFYPYQSEKEILRCAGLALLSAGCGWTMGLSVRVISCSAVRRRIQSVARGAEWQLNRKLSK